LSIACAVRPDFIPVSFESTIAYLITLLSLLEEVISRHVVLERRAALLLAYWVLHT
jgi:hypothetical protein